jgi:hypothetical protein
MVGGEGEVFMGKVSAVIAGLAIVSALASAVTPALALGDCGPNRHRNAAGVCVAGGQNEDYCMKKTGHAATRMPNGTMRCIP